MHRLGEQVRHYGSRAIVRVILGLCGSLILFLHSGSLRAADMEICRKEFFSGNYSNCIRLCEQGLKENEPGESWRLLLAEAYMTVGRYPQAQMVISNALERYTSSLRLRYLGHEVYQQCGLATAAELLLDESIRLAATQPYAYRDAASMVVLGRIALQRGADPQLVLDRLFDQARTSDPKCRDAYLAGGELALDKHDFELASKTFQAGLKVFPEDADLFFGLARAYAPSDAAELKKALESALRCNPHHVPSLLLLADHAVDAESYASAEKTLEEVLAINPWHSEGWAYRAVLSHLRNEGEAEAQARANALHFWKSNPQVDHLIGLKLSQKYRFAEGAALQRQALRFNPNYWPAVIQLAQDLLRLGEEDEGWRLAERVSKNDAYDIVAHNLITLKEAIAKFTVLTNQDFTVRMGAQESAFYGAQVLDLLGRGKAKLGAKYAFKLDSPVTIEIFPEAKDFMVRTFGLPGDSGYLGVCFGRVITAKSPAAQLGHPSNWEAMLWHEFTHVITLQMTHNKMPRWLSEGISVYEEGQANPAWGQRMTPRYRQMILDGELSKISELSAAFLAPKTPLHLQFAYYESSLAVEFMVQRFGRDTLISILNELGKGTEINRTLETFTEPMKQLETDFAAFARGRAEQLAPGLDWEKPPLNVVAEIFRESDRGVRLDVRPSPRSSLTRTNLAPATAPPPTNSAPTPTNAPPRNGLSPRLAARYGLARTNLAPGPTNTASAPTNADGSNDLDSSLAKRYGIAITNLTPAPTNSLSIPANTVPPPTIVPVKIPEASETPSPSSSLIKVDNLNDWLLFHPKNYWGLTEQAKRLLSEKQWETAKRPLQQLIELYPDNAGSDSAYRLLAEACRNLEEPVQEEEALARLAMLSADDTDDYLRLMELAAARKDWPIVKKNAERYLAVNPLVAPPYRFLAQAGESMNQPEPAIESYQRLLLLDPSDPADLHYRLARLLHGRGDPQAKRHALQALEEAPRFRDAYRLLRDINLEEQTKKDHAAAVTTSPAPKSKDKP